MSGQSAESPSSAHPREQGPVAPGEVIDGKYRVLRILGAGGMGVVAAATHVQLGSPVAVKIVRPEVARNREVVARFQREARIAAQLRSDHVVRVMDIGTLPGEPAGVPYMVLEMLDGSDLAELLVGRGPLPFGEAVHYLVQACDGVGEAHALGIVHRDLKPANLFLARRTKGGSLVKVLDFGISSMATGDEDARLTATGSVMGTPLYMAPEQMLDARKADARSDVWALGAILYELLMGAPPFPGNTFGAVHARVITTEAPPLLSRRPDVPAALEAIILRCLRKPPEQRFATVAALEEALRPFAVAPSAQPSSPFDPASAPPSSASVPTRYTAPGVDASAPRESATLVMNRGAALGAVANTPVGPTTTMGTSSTAADAQTTLMLPASRGRRAALGIAAAVVVLGSATAILLVALLRPGRPAEATAVGISASSPSSPSASAPVITPGSAAAPEPETPPPPATAVATAAPLDAPAVPLAKPPRSGAPAPTGARPSSPRVPSKRTSPSKNMVETR
jgi:serine/threonine-protein kinase